jgi:hypothetical protein
MTQKPSFQPLLIALALSFLTSLAAWAQGNPAATPSYWTFAPTPPMGWNSYDAFGASVTEAEVLANATYIKQNLLSHGWQYVVVDYRWYDAQAANYPNGSAPQNPAQVLALTLDGNGRLLPAPSRFPSATNGQGFKPLADKIHALGLKFGFHIMRGIPREAVLANSPIEGSSFHAADAADTKNTCYWNADMYGVRGGTPAGQAYYDSLFRLYASWGLDFVKVDDLSQPYSTAEIEAIRRAIDRCGRPIVFSTSPGETPVAEAGHISTHANMWRVSNDFWDNWASLDHAFDLAYAWQKVGGPGRWPDLDMIPCGHIGIRSVDGPRMTRLTHDEQVMLMSLWCLAPSPLMVGMNLPDNDAWTFGLLTNDEVLALDQDPLGQPATRVSQSGKTETWIRNLSDGSKAAALFNRGEISVTVTLDWAAAGLSGKLAVRDLWRHLDLGDFTGQITLPVPAHGAVLLRLRAK